MPKLHQRKYRKITKQILKRMAGYQQMSDAELQHQTQLLQRQVNGQRRNLKKVLPAAYAVVCEASKRVLGLSPFPVQILGAVAMEDGNVVEMKTGEGKTLTATMPMYLHGLAGRGNYLITANEYLANRDSETMGKLYRWLGLSVSSAVPQPGQDADQRDLAKIYQANIVYTTNSTLGFDYLFDNLAKTKEEQHLPSFNFALLDEADAVLLDAAQTPLVISGTPRVQSNFLGNADQVVKLLHQDRDYQISDDRKNIWFTPEGIVRMEKYLDVDNLLSHEWRDLYCHLVLALRANYLIKKNRDYVVHDDEVVLIDQHNGRELPGMKMQAGMHQAVETKENVSVSQEQRAMATITYQNLFRMFHQLAGMTGTAATDAKEFLEVYNLTVFKVPTNKPNIRIDLPDRLYITNQAKLVDSLQVVKQAYAQRRPILIETGSLELSVLYSRLLLQAEIPHSVLNARSEVKEADIIRHAGELGAVTVSTAMAGRGTDIRIAPAVEKLGGLLVLGTERMQNKRIDNQLRGRAGRQGAPGESVFYTSLEDKIVTEHSTRSVQKFARQHAQQQQQLLGKKSRFKHVIDRAQRFLANQQRAARFETLQYGEITRLQRKAVYLQRDQIMTATDLSAIIQKTFHFVAHEFVYHRGYQNHGETLLEFIYQNIDPSYRSATDLQLESRKQQERRLLQLMNDRLQRLHEQLVDQQQWLYFQRVTLLRAIDQGWIGQVDHLEVLMRVIKERSIAQVNPIYEFQREGQKAFDKMKTVINLKAVQNVTNSEVIIKKDGKIEIEFP
ncbi:preprotein translocase subunit SecA [Fructilactobacillus florum]|uniref:Protein translocase subunit SecA n=1 Tax=Fructilactobacillus florum DSM 22689 = JCM 16035 TaxID=1423745 RepID=A0A0R2CR70_9LACO|nr:preprotein translocase subunit SecA [Fructilactobacillus florum]KRM92244.1 preprotein translocase subunit SecA [Fructilactobacillus florum DSM 22689 = JCM 16035]